LIQLFLSLWYQESAHRSSYPASSCPLILSSCSLLHASCLFVDPPSALFPHCGESPSCTGCRACPCGLLFSSRSRSRSRSPGAYQEAGTILSSVPASPHTISPASPSFSWIAPALLTLRLCISRCPIQSFSAPNKQEP